MDDMKHNLWMPLWIGDYLRDTQHLNRAEHGSYMLLIMAYWTNGGPLRAEDLELQAVARCPDHEWVRTKGLMLRLFKEADGFWTHSRIDRELAAAKDNAEAQFKRTEAARQARLGNVTKNVTDNVTVNVSSRVATSTPPPPPPPPSPLPSKSHTPSGESECYERPAKKKASGSGDYDWLREKLCAEYKREDAELEMGEEQRLVFEVSKRPKIRQEFEQLSQFRYKRGEQYFPQSIAALCQAWQKTLDASRNHSPAHSGQAF